MTPAATRILFLSALSLVPVMVSGCAPTITMHRSEMSYGSDGVLRTTASPQTPSGPER